MYKSTALVEALNFKSEFEDELTFVGSRNAVHSNKIFKLRGILHPKAKPTDVNKKISSLKIDEMYKKNLKNIAGAFFSVEKESA